jgi:hypothetical protein
MYYSYLTGRGRTGSDSTGPLYHAILAPDGYLPSFGKALCGAQPGRLSNGWSDHTSDHATCPKCLKKLEKLGKSAN